jgi:3-oxoacyl-[acyl-carrier protein] reductase
MAVRVLREMARPLFDPGDSNQRFLFLHLPSSLYSDNQVVIHDSDTAGLQNVLAQLGDLGSADRCYPISFDPSNAELVEEAVERILAEFHPVYILVNNSSVLSRTLALDTSIEEWRESFAQNVDSAFLISRALLPTMRKRQWGRIINTCSLAGKTGGATTGIAYSTTKGALQTLTFALARETAKDGITVNAIAPAYIRTPTVEAFHGSMLDMLLKYIPVGRFMEPEEFGYTVKFLAHPMAGFICGEVIDQNGGLLMS